MLGVAWTSEEDDALRQYVAQGLSAAQCAERIGRKERGVTNRASRLRLRFDPVHQQSARRRGAFVASERKRQQRDERKQQAIAFFREGLTRKEIAYRLGVERSAVTKYLADVRHEAPPKTPKPKPRFDIRQALDRAVAAAQAKAEANWRQIAPAVRADVDAGMSILDAAAKYGRGREYIRSWLQHDGWERPKPAPKPQPERKAKRGMAWLNTAGLPKRVAPASSLYIDAATFLAPYYRPVVRADVVERPYEAPKGEPTRYIVGNEVLPAWEMVDRARGLGFPG